MSKWTLFQPTGTAIHFISLKQPHRSHKNFKKLNLTFSIKLWDAKTGEMGSWHPTSIWQHLTTSYNLLCQVEKEIFCRSDGMNEK